MSERPLDTSRTEDPPRTEPNTQQGREGSGVTLADVTFGYHLDESDPHVSILRRLDGSVVADFYARRGASAEDVVEAAEKDYRDLTRASRRG